MIVNPDKFQATIMSCDKKESKYDLNKFIVKTHTSDIRVQTRHSNDLQVHTSDMQMTYE